MLIYIVLAICGGLTKALTVSNTSSSYSKPGPLIPDPQRVKQMQEIFEQMGDKGKALKRMMDDLPNQPGIPKSDFGKDKKPPKDQPKDRKLP